jgi:multidrug efflux pump subunit AcrA (membrane-fusion protein)
MPDATTRPSIALRRRARRRRIVALTAAGAVVLVAAGGGVALALGGPDDSRYRTVRAEQANVEQIVDSVGTIASASRRDAAFSVDGTVATVNVSVGQVVAAGDVLATLDTAALQDAVDKAQADLADAQQQLSDDLDSQTASTTTSTSTSSSSAKSSSTPTATPSASASTPSAGGGDTDSSDPAVAEAMADVQKAQLALLDQYQVTADALATSGASVTASQASCAAFLAVLGTDVTGDGTDSDDGSGDVTPTPDPTATDDATTADDTTTDPDPPPVEQALTDCQAALSGALDAQTATDAQQRALMTLADALDQSVQALQKAIAASAGSSTSTPSTSTPSTSTPSISTPAATTPTQAVTTPATTSTPSSSSSTPNGGTTTVASAATILADQAAIDLEEANVALAQSRLPFASLTSPIAGTVAAVSLAVGDSVSASSTTAVITVLGPDGYTVTTSVPLTKIDIVTVGQTAQITTPSTDAKLTGTVSSIGVLDTSTTADPAYTVELALDATDAKLYDGASAQVHLSVAGADQVLTVPTSAVHVDGATATVQVLKDGTPTDVTVTRGAVGAERTEITDGLSAGDEVVLADLDQAIESSTSSTSTGLSGLGGDANQGGPPDGFVFDGGGQGGPPAGFTGGGTTNRSNG